MGNEICHQPSVDDYLLISFIKRWCHRDLPPALTWTFLSHLQFSFCFPISASHGASPFTTFSNYFTTSYFVKNGRKKQQKRSESVILFEFTRFQSQQGCSSLDATRNLQCFFPTRKRQYWTQRFFFFADAFAKIKNLIVYFPWEKHWVFCTPINLLWRSICKKLLQNILLQVLQLKNTISSSYIPFLPGMTTIS